MQAQVPTQARRLLALQLLLLLLLQWCLRAPVALHILLQLLLQLHHLKRQARPRCCRCSCFCCRMRLDTACSGSSRIQHCRSAGAGHGTIQRSMPVHTRLRTHRRLLVLVLCVCCYACGCTTVLSDQPLLLCLQQLPFPLPHCCTASLSPIQHTACSTNSSSVRIHTWL
jgi:hypothetical protein